MKSRQFFRAQGCSSTNREGDRTDVPIDLRLGGLAASNLRPRCLHVVLRSRCPCRSGIQDATLSTTLLEEEKVVDPGAEGTSRYR